MASCLRSARRCADDVHHRDMLGEASRDGIDSAEFTDAERCHERGGSSHPAVAVRAVASIEFVGAPDPLQGRVSHNVIEQAEGVVARHAKDRAHP